jgi:hypothetical protein
MDPVLLELDYSNLYSFLGLLSLILVVGCGSGLIRFDYDRTSLDRKPLWASSAKLGKSLDFS